ncbi:inositol monophosphatase [Paracoccus alkanivorans]|uniref:Inositol monophosphatase n=1 Tax=Paracoccus alkanivorans TaxID=2116655 RepID=A0A3M0MHJ7_9RHOB|nr:inositol monophosphatase family protein [Paracoccus alkanivorans]RMC37212.1 inositol monophosphatase [Paracoccus alkanivorans]
MALSHFRSLASLPVEWKGHLDPVTTADKDVESFVITSLREAFPNDGIYGEEGGNVTGTSGLVWVIDPIDGTFNFVRGGQNWAISIGLYDNRRPIFGVIYAPVRNLMFTGGTTVETQLNGKPVPSLPPLDLSRASVGIGLHPSVVTKDRIEMIRYISDELRFTFRCCGSTTLSLIEVALGETDGYVALGDSTWDVMAGLLILSSLGISHTIDWDHVDLQEKLRFACGSDTFLEMLRPLLVKVGDSAKSYGEHFSRYPHQ